MINDYSRHDLSMILYVTTAIVVIEDLRRAKCFRTMGPEHATNKIVVRTCNGIEVSSCYRGKSWMVIRIQHGILLVF